MTAKRESFWLSRAFANPVALSPVDPSTCSSPVGSCAPVRLSGTIKAEGTLTVTSLIQTAGTPSTSVIVFTADTSISRGRATLVLNDVSALATSDGSYTDLASVVAGGGRWAGASGLIRIGGTFPLRRFQPATGAAFTAPYPGQTLANWVAFLEEVEG